MAGPYVSGMNNNKTKEAPEMINAAQKLHRQMSAKSPPTTAIALDAVMPQSKRKTKKAGQVGATAHAMVNMVKKTKVMTMTHLRPYDSLNGAKTIGPNT
ncbi:MAG: hypothetical protein Q9169_003998 [Polycauliona sp. 2 TL-2023]